MGGRQGMHSGSFSVQAHGKAPAEAECLWRALALGGGCLGRVQVCLHTRNHYSQQELRLRLTSWASIQTSAHISAADLDSTPRLSERAHVLCCTTLAPFVWPCLSWCVLQADTCTSGTHAYQHLLLYCNSRYQSHGQHSWAQARPALLCKAAERAHWQNVQFWWPGGSCQHNSRAGTSCRDQASVRRHPGIRPTLQSNSMKSEAAYHVAHASGVMQGFSWHNWSRVALFH